MQATTLLARGLLLGALLWSAGAAADCHYHNKLYKEGETVCRAPAQFQCGPLGAWKKLPAACTVKPEENQTSAVDEPATEVAGKPTDNTTEPPHGKAP